MNKTKLTLSSLLFLSLLGFSLFFIKSPSYAQEKPEATESAEKLDWKKYLSVNGVKNVLGLSSDKKEAVIGEVTRVTDETITLSSRHGTKIVPVTKEVSITKGGKDIELTDLAVENWVTVLGKIIEDNFSPVFIYVYSQSLQPKSQYVAIGTITEITRNTITITPRSGDTDKTINILNTTEFEDLNGLEISLSDLEKDITVLVSAHETETKIDALTVRSLAPLADEKIE